MDKDKMIKQILNDMSDYCYCEIYHDCPFEGREAHECNRCKAEALYNAGYRKVADDEIVIKKSEYKELKKYRTDWLNDEKMHLQAELEDTEFELGCSNRLFQKVCEEKKELEKQLERYKNKAKYYYNECKLYGGACYIDSDLEDKNE
jgi:phage pi2 protein 07